MTDTPKTKDTPRVTHLLIHVDVDGKLIDLETFGGKANARDELDNRLPYRPKVGEQPAMAGWKYLGLQPGQTYAEAQAARS